MMKTIVVILVIYAAFLAAPYLTKKYVAKRLYARAGAFLYLSLLLAIPAATLLALGSLVSLLPAPLSIAGLIQYCSLVLQNGANLVGAALPILGLALLAGGIALLSLRSRRLHQALCALSLPLPSSEGLASGEVACQKVETRVLPVQNVFACTLGIVSHSVLVSEGLRQQLSDAELRAVWAHELGHARGKDNLWLLVGNAFARPLLFLPPVAIALAEFKGELEAAADAFACRCVKDPLLVAAAITKVAKLAVDQPAYAAALQGEGQIARRVHRLLDIETKGAPRRLAATAGALVALSGLVGLGVSGYTTGLIGFGLCCLR